MNNKMLFKVMIIGMYCNLLLTSALVNANKLDADVVIIVGKPYKVKDSPNEVTFEKVSIGSKYIAYFRDYKVVSGSFEKKRRVLKVELIASSSSIITYPEEIYVIIEKSKNKILESWSWGTPKYSICLSVDGIADLGLSNEFHVVNEGIGCKGIYQHGK